MSSDLEHVIWLPSGEPIVLSSGEYERALSRGVPYRGPERSGVSAEGPNRTLTMTTPLARFQI